MDLSWIVPRSDASLMDKYQCIKSAIVARLLREGHVDNAVRGEWDRGAQRMKRGVGQSVSKLAVAVSYHDL